jgi:hypothetical protein
MIYERLRLFAGRPGSDFDMQFIVGAAADHARKVEKAGLSANGAKRRVPHAAVSVSAPLHQRPQSIAGAWPPRFLFDRRLMQILGAGAVGLVSILLLTGLFLRLMNYELRKDEQLYVPPARLLDNQSLYQDFFYNHTPGAAWLFHGLRQLLGSNHLLFDGRIGVLLAWLILAAAIGALAYALTRSAWISWSIVVVSLVNELFLTQTGMSATNNFLPLPFAFIGFGLLVVAVSSRTPLPWIALTAGFFLSVAVVFKLIAVGFILPAAMGAILIPRHLSIGERLWRVALPLAGGGLIGGLPILYFIVTDHARFLAHVVGYHLGPHARYFQDGTAPDGNAVTTLAGKLALAHELWLGGTIAVGLAALAMLIGIWARDEGHRERPAAAQRGVAFLLAGAFCVSAGFSLIPTPSFPQYFAPPLICLPLGLIVLVAGLSPAGREQARVVLIAASVIVVAAQAPRLLQHVGTITSPQRWAVTRVHASGVEIARQLAAARLTGKVATLAPVYPLEGGLPVYPELATGPFAFRTADRTAHELGALYQMVSPAGVAELFDADPPAAFLLGFEPELEKTLLDYATARGYLPLPDFQIRDRYGTAQLYVRPAG